MLQNKLHAFVARLTVSLDLSLAMALFLIVRPGVQLFFSVADASRTRVIRGLA